MRLAPPVALAALFALLAGCAAPGPAGSGAAVEAPTFRSGDRWVYRVHSGWANPLVFDETWTVTAAGPAGIDFSVVGQGPGVDERRTERWSAPGLVTQGALFDSETRRFDAPLELYRFPLQAGQRWDQRVGNFNEFTNRAGIISRTVQVVGFEKVTVPAGTFDALRLQVFITLDDGEFWRWPTRCTYEVWYAPAVRGIVRERKRAGYVEKSGFDTGISPAQNETIELLSFTPGG
jgi:hypothetical protein